MPSTETQVFDTVSIQNIDDEDFIFEYDKSKGNYPYIIPAGQVKRFPRFLAEHAVKHLIDKILNKIKLTKLTICICSSSEVKVIIKFDLCIITLCMIVMFETIFSINAIPIVRKAKEKNL